MTRSNARILLSMLGNFNLNEILAAGALDAISELKAASGPSGQLYMIVPQTVQHGLRRVDAIKTARVMFGLGLKEAKDMIDEELNMSSVTIRNGDAVRIGPFNTSVDVAEVLDHLASVRETQTGILEVEVF